MPESMKVLFKIIKANSGSDFYYERLAKALRTFNVETEIIYYRQWILKIVPFLIFLFNKPTDCDILHTNADYGWALKEQDKPLVITLFHNVFDKEYLKNVTLINKLYYFFLRLSIRKSLVVADGCVAISDHTKTSFENEFGENDIQRIYCGIEIDKYKPLPVPLLDKRFKLLFVGNFIRRKGADLLPKIMESLGENYVLYVTLTPKDSQKLHLPNNIVPIGRPSDKTIIKLYNQCDAFLFPTRLEGFGYVVVEAMACAKPIIATDCSSLSEIVINNKGGLLCKIDDINDFVAAIHTLADNKTLRKRMGKFNQRQVVKRFDLLKMGRQYVKFYKTVI
ncbi:MAG: hypothetical protein UW73_C0001G0062 [Microgenomates group bacterium GW2011_GWB1_44_8]|nr:MAG: hypothetical protein UW73_C0001G0062 [Microgenomates group bacterium GW2011_GWB1_44_8]